MEDIMNQELKRISIVTPCFNDGDTLELHITTFLDQDYENKELLLVDDGSTDNTKKLIKKYEKENPGVVRGIILPQNKGACIARNIGAKEATGDVYSFLPADSFLEPGLLTYWMNALERHPEHGFVYGGYKFVDSTIAKPTWLGGQLVDVYPSASFDVRQLEIANYIDGSFPIRKEVFWDSAKKVGLPDGLWNPNVKSLQDWDFWLSVVKEGGYTGGYANEITFETTVPHAGGLSADSHNNWLARVKQIHRLHNIPERDICVTSLSSHWHAHSIATVLDADFKPFPPQKQHDYKAIYLIGFFTGAFFDHIAVFMQPAQLANIELILNNQMPLRYFPGKKLIHWVGSDVLGLAKLTPEQLFRVKTWIEQNVDGNLCEFEVTQKELADFGIKSEIVPFPPRKWYDVAPLPKKKAVAIYLPEVNQEFYFHAFFVGDEKHHGLAHEMKDIDFYIFGNSNEKIKPAKNIHIMGKTDGVGSFINETNAIVRLTPHDGLPISVAEWIGAGRNALTTVEMPFAEHLDLLKIGKNKKTGELKSIVEKKIRALVAKPLNEKGAKHYRSWLNEKKYVKKINSFLKYDEKKYWEKRSTSWIEQSKVDEVKSSKLKKIIKQLDFKSVLDVGCGSGRFVPLFEGKEYEGCDISKTLIEHCKKEFKGKFHVLPAEDVDALDKKFDLIFSYTCLEHVKPENLEKVAFAFKQTAKKLLLIEPVNFVPQGEYCFNHDYSKYFKIEKKINLGDKIAHIITL